MALNKVEICGVDTSKLPVLNQKQMRALLLRVKDGDTAARDEFLRSNLRLVLSVIQRFANRGEQMDDLFQVGCIGLIKALDNFDLAHDVKFSTYAVPMIIGEVRRHLRDNNTIRVSRSLRDTAYKALQARTRLMDELSPRTNRCGDREGSFHVRRGYRICARRDTGPHLSVRTHLSRRWRCHICDGSDRRYKVSDTFWLDTIAIGQGLDHLADREQRILQMRFFEGKTQMEVSREIGISQAQVSRLEKNALKHMQKFV